MQGVQRRSWREEASCARRLWWLFAEMQAQHPAWSATRARAFVVSADPMLFQWWHSSRIRALRHCRPRLLEYRLDLILRHYGVPEHLKQWLAPWCDVEHVREAPLTWPRGPQVRDRPPRPSR
jgi:hypothetical protein